MNICVFKRYEIKYIINSLQYAELFDRAQKFLTADVHGRSTIQSLYYDTESYRLVRRSLEKPEFKEKLRLRSYGLARESDPVFLELKRKCSGVVYKRRIETTSEKIKSGDWGGSQIAGEIEYFMRFYGDLSPKMLLIYDRTAYSGEDGLRVTFDRNIRYRTDRLSLGSGLDGIHLLGGDNVLMEIKTGAAIPLWLTGILDGLHIYKSSFSKYGEAYTREMSRDLIDRASA